MEKEEYKVMYQIEDSYWWYVGLRKLVFSSIDKFASKERNLKILDAGCGTGKTLESCKAYDASGLDFSEEAIQFCQKRGLNNIVQGSICNIPFSDNSFDVVISLDVLYHANVYSDLKALQEFYRVVNKNGIVVLNVPAYNFLRGRHDIAVHTRRRYTCKELLVKIEKAGFSIEKLTYRNTVLFPAAFIKRILEMFFMSAEHIESDLKPLPGVFNKILTGVLSIENFLIMSGIRFPFGLSVFCIARK
ncbi:MAG: class I SAM-dependent methyltransferase [Candidatus Omnitrophica bacterium]|nr:class I SAM-dependent methyltransferase [Candidatus Omnitrophota bacterium]